MSKFETTDSAYATGQHSLGIKGQVGVSWTYAVETIHNWATIHKAYQRVRLTYTLTLLSRKIVFVSHDKTFIDEIISAERKWECRMA